MSRYYRQQEIPPSKPEVSINEVPELKPKLQEYEWTERPESGIPPAPVVGKLDDFFKPDSSDIEKPRVH